MPPQTQATARSGARIGDSGLAGRLRRELEEARQEIAFLKKTAGYFAALRQRDSR